MFKLAIILGAGNAAIAIVFGAFAAHALKDKLNERMLDVFNTATDYHLYHALGLIIVGILIKLQPSSILLNYAVYMMLIGILLFCGSLYGLSLTNISKLGMITPFGGLAFIAAWICVLAAFIK